MNVFIRDDSVLFIDQRIIKGCSGSYAGLKQYNLK